MATNSNWYKPEDKQKLDARIRVTASIQSNFVQTIKMIEMGYKSTRINEL